MPRTSPMCDTYRNLNSTFPNDATALERLRHLVDVPPSQRMTDLENPLEKIEQLLTCSICLDRFRHPKLLPCHHTYCMEPCLESLVDLVRNTVKCPECRAEHVVPVDGVKQFQTNFSLIGFLEIHIQATEDNAAALESYIKRYNLERCKICNEKAEVDLCFHCEKKICAECRLTHLDILKRDLGRLVNQVKRIASRISDSVYHLSKSTENFVINCDTAKDEVKDHVNRFIKELRKRETSLLTDIDTFKRLQSRMSKNTFENLESELSNVTEACLRVDQLLKRVGNQKVSPAHIEQDLIRYKQLFVEGIEYLKTLNLDFDDSGKKLRFVIGPDPHLLPHAISQFGELQICTPQFNQKLTGQEHFYVPKFANLGLDGDHVMSKHRIWENKQLDISPTNYRNERPNSKKIFTNNSDIYAASGNSRLKEPAWQRLKDSMFQSPPNGTTDTIDNTTRDSQDHIASSPWSRVNQEITQSPAQNLNNPMDIASNVDSLSLKSDTRIIQALPNDRHCRRQSAPVLSQSELTSRSNLNAANKRPIIADQKASIQIKLTTRSFSESKAQCSRYSSEEEEEEEEEDEEKPESQNVIFNENLRLADDIPIKMQMFDGGMCLSVSEHNLSNEQANSLLANSEWKQYLLPDSFSKTINKSGADKPPSNRPNIGSCNEVGLRALTNASGGDYWQDRRNRFVRSKTNPELSLDLPVVLQDTRHNKHDHRSPNLCTVAKPDHFSRDASQYGIDGHNHYTNQRVNRESERRNRYKRKAEKSHSNHVMLHGTDSDAIHSGLNRSDSNWAVYQQGPGSKFYRQLYASKINYAEKGNAVLTFGSKGSIVGQFNWPRGLWLMPITGDIAVCDSSNHRLQVFDKRGVFLKSVGNYGSSKGEFDCLAGVCINKYGQFLVSDRYNHRVQIFDANGRHLREFGSHGQSNGRFNSPWGLAVDQQGFIYVCDKDNNRVQIFQADGTFVGKFGSLGNRDGQFQNPHFVAINRQNHIIVSDTNNHRLQVFDRDGRYLFHFGSEGFHEGQFKYPRGVAVDDQGLIFVADSGNNRVQIFWPDGRYCTHFGTWGSLEGQLKGVEGVAVSDDGSVIVSDRDNHRIQIF